MRRIIYRSVAGPELDRAGLFRLLYHARIANERRGLSGVLLRADDRLLQVIEGPTWKLVATFDTIRRDVRHAGIEVLDERSIPKATFPDWPMRYFDDRDLRKALHQITIGAGGSVPAPIQTALTDFFDGALVDADRLSPSPLRAGLPSSPRPC
jgi:hypothetical protein